jgi:hypothetical protein
MAGNGHYYSPSQIKLGNGPFVPRKSAKDAKIGDIVVMLGAHHVEIVTRLKNYSRADKGFCSRGAGRPFQKELGTEKCDESYFIFDEDRELGNSKNTFYHL